MSWSRLRRLGPLALCLSLGTAEAKNPEPSVNLETVSASGTLAFTTPEGRPLDVEQSIEREGRTIGRLPGGAGSAIVRYSADPQTVRVDVEVGADHDLALRASWTLPIEAQGWIWCDDLRTNRRIEGGSSYGNLATGTVETMSVYPWATIVGPCEAITLALPLDQPRVSRTEYQPGRGLTITFDLGVSPAAARLNGRATFSFLVYTSDPGEGMRGAVAKYYRIYPQFFRRRRGAPEGAWHVGFPVLSGPGAARAPELARDFGLGLNQVWLGEVLTSKELYYSTSYRVPWDNAHGIVAGDHENWFYLKLDPCQDAATVTYAQAIAALQRQAAGEAPVCASLTGDDAQKMRAESQAAWNSAARDRQGRLEYAREGNRKLLDFFVNNETNEPGLNWCDTAVRWQIGRALEQAKAAGGHLDSLLMDGVAGLRRSAAMPGWSAVYDYSRSHWAAASMPLTYDHTDPEHPVAELLAFPNYAGLRRFAAEAHRLIDDAHPEGLTVAANMYSPLNRPGGWFGADVVDYWCVENSLANKAKQGASTVDAVALWKRALAWQRPISTLDVPGSTVPKEYFAAQLDQNLFYDIFPGFQQRMEGREGTMMSPEVVALFRRYVPLYRLLAGAGWQPVTFAESDNGNLLLERYGDLGAGVTYLALRNETASEQAGMIHLRPQDGRAYGAIPRIAALLRPQSLLGSLEGEGVVGVRADLPPHSTEVWRISVGTDSSTVSDREAARRRRLEEVENRLHDDWAYLDDYRTADLHLAPPAPGEQRVVFMGDSITERWSRAPQGFFPGRPYVNRGISGQTTPQMLVRFRQDVIALRPRVVVINGGTNDIAGNTGPSSLQMIEDNLASMRELAAASGIRVVLGLVTPTDDYPWKREVHPAARIRELNDWIRAYCRANGCECADYYAPLAAADGGMKPGLSVDGVHPNSAGYALMAPIAEEAIARALSRRPTAAP